MLHKQCFESWMNWATKFCLIHHIHLTSRQPTPLLQGSRQLFTEQMLPQPVGCRKCFPRVHWIPKRGFLCYRNKQNYFSLAKMCWIIIITILIGEDMFKPSYKDPDAGKDWRKEEKGMTGDDRGWDGWMTSPTRWTWIWVSSESWWWTGKLECCSPWGCKELDMTEWLSWTELFGLWHVVKWPRGCVMLFCP